MQFVYVTAGGNRVATVFRVYCCTLRLYKEDSSSSSSFSSSSSSFSFSFPLPLLPFPLLSLPLSFSSSSSSFFLHYNSTWFLVVCKRSFQALLSVMSWAHFLSVGVPLIFFGVCFGRLQYLPGFTSVELVTLIFARLGR